MRCARVFDAPTVAQLAPRIGEGSGGLAPLVAGERPGGGAVVVCPEPVVVPRPVAGALTGLQHGGGVAAERARLMPTRWVRRWPMWWAATRACAPCSRRPTGYRGSWWCRPSGPISVGRSSMPPAGRRTGWSEAIEAVARSPFRPGRRDPFAGTAFPRRRRRARAGGGGAPYRRGRLVGEAAGCAIWAWPMPAGARARRRTGRRCRCSTSITRCGSARSSVIWTIGDSRSPRSWGIGSRRWPGCPSGCSCPPIGPIRRWPITAAPVWRWTGRRELQQRVREVARRAQRDQLHGDAGRVGGAAVQAQRQFRCGGGLPDRRAR